MLAPLAARDWDEQAVRHLLARTGFGVRDEDVQPALQRGMKATVERLLNPESVPYHLPPPALTADSAASDGNALLALLRQWWLQRMRESPRPLEEKMTLFWHSHFATQADKIDDPVLVLQHNELLRRHAFDYFGLLITVVARDPAMIRFLDLETSHRDRPNDNFARELMELYTLGEGAYTEDDVRAAGRAFTGWGVQDGRAVFDPMRHDESEKTFLGQRGNWNSEDIVRILMEQPAFRTFIPRKLFSFFAYPEPAEEVEKELAARFDEVYFSIKDWLRTLFCSQLFYSPAARAARVKSPVEFVTGLYRRFGVSAPPDDITQLALRRMGQELFQPPDVDGWREGTRWINTQTLMMRYHFAYFCVTGTVVEGLLDRSRAAYATPAVRTGYAPLFNARDGVPEADYRHPELCADHLVRRVLGRGVSATERQQWVAYFQTASNNARVVFHLANRMSEERFQNAAYLLLCSPEYQVC
jgi:uncharacterized protein (DUF1800 family)